MRRVRQIQIGPVIAAAGAVLLIVSLFLDWYDEFSAFTVFEVLDLVLVALALAMLVALVEAMGLVRGIPLRGAAAGALQRPAGRGERVVERGCGGGLHQWAAVDRDVDDPLGG